MFERSEFVSLPAWRIALTGTRRAASCGRLSLLTFFGEAKKVSSRRAEGVCACKRIPLRRRIACDPNSLLHPPGKPPRRTNRLVFSKGIRREALRLSTPTFSISMQISLPSDPLATRRGEATRNAVLARTTGAGWHRHISAPHKGPLRGASIHHYHFNKINPSLLGVKRTLLSKHGNFCVCYRCFIL